MECSHSIVAVLHAHCHYDTHEDQDGGIVEPHEGHEELHEAVLVKHRMPLFFQVGILANQSIELILVHCAKYFSASIAAFAPLAAAMTAWR